MPDADAAASYRAGLTAEAAGDLRGAASGFLTAFALEPGAEAHRRAAFGILNLMTGYRSLPAPVIAGLEACAELPELDLQPLSLVVRNLSEGDARLAVLETIDDHGLEAALPEAVWLLDSRLTRAMLTRAVNISERLEAVFTRLRAHLCLAVAAGRPSLLRDRFRDFSIALAAQCVTNRQLWAESAAETAALQQMSARGDDDELLLRVAYRPLTEIDANDVARLPPLLAAAWHDNAEERRRAADLPQLTPLAQGLSLAMQAQYEAYPYPRWRQFDRPRQMPLRTFLEAAAPYESFAALTGAGTILVAGCGTGLPALTLAKTLPDATITAVDLSRISLAYAQSKAAKLNARNITFSVADILALGDMRQRFDFIECSGVLHHMHDPAAGLTVLRALLNPGGALLISLYSERGRVAEAAAQAFVRAREFPDTPAGLRAARAEIMALPPEHPARGVIDTPDFFTRDGVHDLIFNLHESRITPAAMKRLLTSCGLRAIAVDAPPKFGGTDFKTRYPDSAAQADLDLWDAFEQQHSQVFAHMIKVWCRPIAD